MLTGKQAADHFADIATHMKATSQLALINKKKQEGHNERDQPTEHLWNLMKRPLTLRELRSALKKLKAKKSPGPDGISNEN